MRVALAVLVLVSGCDVIWRVDQHSDAFVPKDMFVIHDVSCADGVLVGTGWSGGRWLERW